MQAMNRQAFLGLVLAMLCMLFFLLCFGWSGAQTAAFADQPSSPRQDNVAVTIAQSEQNVEIAVRPNNQYSRPNSPLTLKQTHHYLSIAVSLVLLVLFGNNIVYLPRFNRTCLFVTSWHLLRAPPKTES